MMTPITKDGGEVTRKKSCAWMSVFLRTAAGFDHWFKLRGEWVIWTNLIKRGRFLLELSALIDLTGFAMISDVSRVFLALIVASSIGLKWLHASPRVRRSLAVTNRCHMHLWSLPSIRQKTWRMWIFTDRLIGDTRTIRLKDGEGIDISLPLHLQELKFAAESFSAGNFSTDKVLLHPFNGERGRFAENPVIYLETSRHRLNDRRCFSGDAIDFVLLWSPSHPFPVAEGWDCSCGVLSFRVYCVMCLRS